MYSPLYLRSYSVVHPKPFLVLMCSLAVITAGEVSQLLLFSTLKDQTRQARGRGVLISSSP